MTKFLVTGAAGFVGSHLTERLLNDGQEVVGLDAFVPYYPRAMKEENLIGPMGDPAFRNRRTEPGGRRPPGSGP